MLDYHFAHPGNPEYCRATYHETTRWLHLTWAGVATTADGHCAAAELLRQLPATAQVQCLLNDNSQVLGPWFDSLDWLQRLWVPQARRLGLGYVAHVPQPHTEDDLGLLLRQNLFAGKFELQFFTTVADAECWLLECQQVVMSC